VSDWVKEPTWLPGPEPNDELAEPELQPLLPGPPQPLDGAEQAFPGLIRDWNRLPAELPWIHQLPPVPTWAAGRDWLLSPVDE
jgi:hypothetical protein